MTIAQSKFNIAPYAQSSAANYQAYADEILTALKNAFVATGNGWQLETDIETVGSYTGTSYGLRTLQLKRNGTTEKHLRIWCFSSDVSGSFVSSATTNTSYSLKIYLGNLMKVAGGSSTPYAQIGGYSEIFFGVSSSNIDADFAKDLGLDIPIFGIRGGNGNSVVLSRSDNGAASSGATISVITNGSMFTILEVVSNATTTVYSCIYADDLFVCANSSDTHTAGAYSGVIDMGTSETLSASTLGFVFSDANGGFDFVTLKQNITMERTVLLPVETSSYLPTGPVFVSMTPNIYAGSTGTGIINGIGFKGWVNTNYLRVASYTSSPASHLTYASGAWFMINQGTLIPWSSTFTDPRESAVTSSQAT